MEPGNSICLISRFQGYLRQRVVSPCLGIEKKTTIAANFLPHRPKSRWHRFRRNYKESVVAKSKARKAFLQLHLFNCLGWAGEAPNQASRKILGGALSWKPYLSDAATFGLTAFIQGTFFQNLFTIYSTTLIQSTTIYRHGSRLAKKFLWCKFF